MSRKRKLVIVKQGQLNTCPDCGRTGEYILKGLPMPPTETGSLVTFWHYRLCLGCGRRFAAREVYTRQQLSEVYKEGWSNG